MSWYEFGPHKTFEVNFDTMELHKHKGVRAGLRFRLRRYVTGRWQLGHRTVMSGFRNTAMSNDLEDKYREVNGCPPLVREYNLHPKVHVKVVCAAIDKPGVEAKLQGILNQAVRDFKVEYGLGS